jgi:hypothetical protein
MRANPIRCIEEPSHRARPPALPPDGRTEGGELTVERRRSCVNADLRSSRRGPSPPVHAGIQAERDEISSQRGRVFLHRCVDRGAFAVLRQVTVAGHIGDEADEFGRDVEFLADEPDRRNAEHLAARLQVTGIPPAGRRPHTMIGRQAERSSVGKPKGDDRPTVACHRSDVWLCQARGTVLKALHAVVPRHLLDWNCNPVAGADPGTLGDAADVIANARRRDVALVGNPAADRLRVARVVVGAENSVVRVPCLHAALQLLEAPLIHIAKGLDVHVVPPSSSN